eukprot:g4399.t1
MEKGDTVFAALAFAECLRCYDHQDDWPAEILYHLGKMYFHMNEKYSAYTSMLAAYKRNCYHIKTRACLLAWDPESWKNLFEVQDRAIVKMQGLVRGHVIRLWDKFFRASRGIQARMRMMLKRNRYRKWRTSAILIEATWRGYAVRVGKDLETILRFKATCLIQRIWRGFIARRRVLEIRYKRMEGVVIYVQCVARRFIAQAKVRRWHLGATKLQSLWRMHITRLYLFSIGILPLVRWVQIGASFIPLPMVRRDANWEVGKGKMWLGKIESVTKALDLTVKGLYLKANIRPAIESIRRQIQKEDDYAAYRAARERDTETYLKNLATLENAQTTAMSLLDRSRRRIASSTPRWLQKIAAAINDLKQHGHQPLTMWRARLQLHIEATVFALVEVHGDNQIAVGLKALSSNINRLSANQLRSELYTVLKEGEQFETKRSRDFRSLVAEFRAARRKAKRATKRIHELKTRLAALNKENELSISLLKTKYSQNEDEESSAAASPPALPSLRNKIQLQPLSPPFSQPGTVGAGSAVDSNTHAITAEGKLLERCRQLGSMLRTREDEDSLSGEYKRLLAQCCNLGSWQVALKCHAYMAELKLPRDRQAYTQVLICLKKSPEHPYPHEIAFATLEEMEHLGMCEKSVTPYLLVMDGIAISESRVDPKKRSSLWRQALRVLSKLREKGHKATTAVHEVLARCCVRGSPEQVYEGLKWAGIPEYLCYSIAQKALMFARGALQLFCCFACVVADSNVFQADFHRFEDLPSGTVGDANCNVETVETANDDQLNSILMELTNTTFFRLYKVDLSAKCIFWQKEKHSEKTCGGEKEEDEGVSENSKPISNFLKEKKKKPTLCSLTTGTGASLPWGPQSSPVKKLSRSAGVADKVVEGCKDSALPEFWLDLCPTAGVNTLDKVDYVDLQTNPERFTGYNGSKLWDAIYQENCFSRQRATGREPAMGELCYEERVLYRLLSGMHSAINIHIALQYFPPRKGKRTEWAPNPQRFLDMFHEHPERLKNMHFAFVVLLRALRKAAPALETFPMAIGDEAEDKITKQLLQRLLQSHILKSC